MSQQITSLLKDDATFEKNVSNEIYSICEHLLGMCRVVSMVQEE
jgi:hypothetical protein